LAEKKLAFLKDTTSQRETDAYFIGSVVYLCTIKSKIKFDESL